jgi:energy-converting hydrogenase A subunit M
MGWNNGEARRIMVHRHLNHQQLTLAAIDDVISRGNREDWAELREAVLADRALLRKVLQVCRARIADPRAQRYHFWMHYAEARAAA